MLPVKRGEPKAPYDDSEGCDHEYDEDEDTAEYVCTLCGDRLRIPLDKIMRD
jgi:hypothetical protein